MNSYTIKFKCDDKCTHVHYLEVEADSFELACDQVVDLAFIPVEGTKEQKERALAFYNLDD